MSQRKPRQGRLRDVSTEFLAADNIIQITTDGKSIEQIVEAMMAVPMDKSILLDCFIGWEPGDPLDEDHADLKRLQQMLNSRFHGQRFDWLGDNMIAQMARASIATESWNPHKRKDEREQDKHSLD